MNDNNFDDGLVLINDDCINAMQDLIKENIKVDLILTDPPYGKNKQQLKLI